VLTGGDDHALAATLPADARQPVGVVEVGQVAVGEGVTVDGQPWTGPGGHDHFA
jgi:thiamine-monophosphate kinase